ncbi:LOW QUALITY PROTEIN: hypothetical protein V2J09_010898 [Rumex salicifolius]
MKDHQVHLHSQVLQDPITKDKVIKGDRVGGLYVLHDGSRKHRSVAESSNKAMVSKRDDFVMALTTKAKLHDAFTIKDLGMILSGIGGSKVRYGNSDQPKKVCFGHFN